MYTNTAFALLAALASAVIFASVLTGSFLGILVGYFTNLPVMAVGLSLGVTNAAIAALAGTAAVALFGGLSLAVPYGLLFALPALVLVRQALLRRPASAGTVEWYPGGYLAVWLVGLAALLFGGTLALLSREEGGVAAALSQLLTSALGKLGPAAMEGVDPAAVQTWAIWVPGIAAASWMVMTAVNGTLAQALLVRAGRNVRPSAEFAQLRLPPWLVAGVGMGFAAWLLGDGFPKFIGQLFTVVCLTAFLIQGLAVVHAVSRHWHWRVPFLAAFYVFLVIINWLVAPVIVLGLAEQWLRLRERMGIADTGGRAKEE